LWCCLVVEYLLTMLLDLVLIISNENKFYKDYHSHRWYTYFSLLTLRVYAVNHGLGEKVESFLRKYIKKDMLCVHRYTLYRVT
jgi:hypothetical protein